MPDLSALRVGVGRRLIAAGCESEGIKLLACGSPFSLVCGCCGMGREIIQSCRRKWCPECERARSAEVVSIYTPATASIQWPLFFTGTIRHDSTDSVADVFGRVIDGWARLKKQRWFKNCVGGGIGAVEISTPDEVDDWNTLGSWNGVHPHVHALLECRWLSITIAAPRPGATRAEIKQKAIASQREVREQWRLATRSDDAGIFIRRAKPGTLEEVLKYSMKPGAMIDARIDIRALVDAMSRRKMVVPWGSVRKLVRAIKKKHKLERPPMVCECGSEEWSMDPTSKVKTATTEGFWFKGADGFIQFRRWPGT